MRSKFILAAILGTAFAASYAVGSVLGPAYLNGSGSGYGKTFPAQTLAGYLSTASGDVISLLTSGTPTNGQVLTYIGANTAVWQTPNTVPAPSSPGYVLSGVSVTATGTSTTTITATQSMTATQTVSVTGTLTDSTTGTGTGTQSHSSTTTGTSTKTGTWTLSYSQTQTQTQTNTITQSKTQTNTTTSTNTGSISVDDALSGVHGVAGDLSTNSLYFYFNTVIRYERPPLAAYNALVSGLAAYTDYLYSDGTNVYFTVNSANGYIYSRPTSSPGTANTFISGGSDVLLGVASDGTNVYWADSTAGVIFVRSTGGGSTYTFANSQTPTGGVSVDATNVYWADGNTTIKYQAIAGGGASSFVTGQTTVRNIYSDGQTLWWTDDGSSTIMAKSISGGSAFTFASGLSAPIGIYVNGTYVFWSDNGGVKYKSKVMGTGTSTATATSTLTGTSTLTSTNTITGTFTTTATQTNTATETSSQTYTLTSTNSRTDTQTTSATGTTTASTNQTGTQTNTATGTGFGWTPPVTDNGTGLYYFPSATYGTFTRHAPSVHAPTYNLVGTVSSVVAFATSSTYDPGLLVWPAGVWIARLWLHASTDAYVSVNFGGTLAPEVFVPGGLMSANEYDVAVPVPASNHSIGDVVSATVSARAVSGSSTIEFDVGGVQSCLISTPMPLFGARLLGETCPAAGTTNSTWTFSPYTVKIAYRGRAGGGGGGEAYRAYDSNGYLAAGGGGQGGRLFGMLTVAGQTQICGIYVGQKGLGGQAGGTLESPNFGASGGVTSFTFGGTCGEDGEGGTSYAAYGGGGGYGVSGQCVQPCFTLGGQGGDGHDGNGASGMIGISQSVHSGSFGVNAINFVVSGFGGAGGISRVLSSGNGFDAVGDGGGGSGAAIMNDVADWSGGNGADGYLCFIEYGGQ